MRYTFLAILAIVIGFIAGLRYGDNVVPKMEAAPNAYLLALELEDLRKGNIEYLIDTKEIVLNTMIIAYKDFDESLVRYIWPEDKEILRQTIVGAVQYRMKNPYHETEFPKEFYNLYEEERAKALEARAHAQLEQRKRDLQIMLKRYGEKSHNKSPQPTGSAGG